MHYKPVDRCFNMEFGYWNENFSQRSIFVQNGITNNEQADVFFNFDTIRYVIGQTWMCPPFENKVVEQTPTSKIIMNQDGLLAQSGRALTFSNQGELLNEIDQLISRDCRVTPACPDLRIRHVFKGSTHCYILVNEGMNLITFTLHIAIEGEMSFIDLYAWTDRLYQRDESVTLHPYETRVIKIVPEAQYAGFNVTY